LEAYIRLSSVGKVEMAADHLEIDEDILRLRKNVFATIKLLGTPPHP
jgi:hypothetical protein